MGGTRVADSAAGEVLVGATGGSTRMRGRAADSLAAADAAGRAVSETASHLLVAAVPVHTRRREAVDRTYGELFPRVRTMWASPVDARGWRAGVAAADRADVSSGSSRSRLPG